MSQAKRIDAVEAKRLIDDEGWIYVDVRTVSEYDAGHPVGAKNVPFMHAGPDGRILNEDFVRVMEANFPKDAKLVLGCASGRRSASAGAVLVEVGYEHLTDLKTGYGGAKNAQGEVVEPGWFTAGYPTETTTAGGSYDELSANAG